jgi:hypothetical protein
VTSFPTWVETTLLAVHFSSESNLLELARGLVRELFPNSFSISFSQTADWQRFRDLWNNVAFCQSAAREKEIEKEFGINSRTSPLTSSKRLDSGLVLARRPLFVCPRRGLPCQGPLCKHCLFQLFLDCTFCQKTLANY